MCRLGRVVISLGLLTALSGCVSVRSNDAAESLRSLAARGMVRVDAHRYVVVNGTRVDATGPRIGRIDIARPGAPGYAECEANWDEVGGPSHELAAACAIPGRAGEYLAAESGYEGDHFGRIFHFTIEEDERGGLTARIIRTLPLPRLYGPVEAMAIGLAANGDLIMILGESGADGRRGKLSWGPLRVTDDSISFRIQGDAEFTAPWRGDPAGLRHCADMHIDSANRLWIVATNRDGQRGPFRSVIFRYGDFDPRRRQPMRGVDSFEPAWTVDGCRIEAIAASPNDDRSLCFISDDGALGSAWRPLLRPE